MDQPTADLEYQGKKRRTRRELFLQRMDGLIPWQRLEERIRPVYPKPGKGGPYPLPVRGPRQLFYNLNPGMEDLLYEAESVRRDRESIPPWTIPTKLKRWYFATILGPDTHCALLGWSVADSQA